MTQAIDESKVTPNDRQLPEPGDAPNDTANTETEADSTRAKPQAAAAERLVPVSEAIRYRKRAQAAEQQLEQSAEQLRDLETALDEARQTVTHLERRQRVDALLAEAGAIDLDVARMLTEAAVEVMDDADVESAVDDLRRDKPYLFRKSRTNGHGAPAGHAMSAHVRDDASDDTDVALNEAATTGNRQALLRYLRLRRGTA